MCLGSCGVYLISMISLCLLAAYEISSQISCGSLLFFGVFVFRFLKRCISCAAFESRNRRIILSLTGAEPGDQLPFKTNLHLKCITKSCAHNAIFWQSHAGLAELAVVHCLPADWQAFKLRISNQAASNGE